MARVVLDVNVVVSALLAPRGTPRLLLMAWQDSRFTVLASDGIIQEIREKLGNPRIGGAYNVMPDDVRWVTTLLLREAEPALVPPESVWLVTGDPEDDYVLATRPAGRRRCPGNRGSRAPGSPEFRGGPDHQPAHLPR